jgi:hypothetical protein
MRIQYSGFRTVAIVAMLFLSSLVTNAQAQIRVTEVCAYGSGFMAYASDWFELTNFGCTTVDITGWRFDDSNPQLATSVPLDGITSIAPGESVIFINDSGANAAFTTAWFGGPAPKGLQIGNYAGGAGLSTGGDQVNIFDASNKIVASITFGTSPNPLFATFDNSEGLNNVTVTELSQVGVNSAFVASDGAEVGSPGVPAFVLGDANGDGNFDFGDIEAFFLALTDPVAYAAAFPNVNPDVVLDFDGDCTASFGDIEGFFAALTGG